MDNYEIDAYVLEVELYVMKRQYPRVEEREAYMTRKIAELRQQSRTYRGLRKF